MMVRTMKQTKKIISQIVIHRFNQTIAQHFECQMMCTFQFRQTQKTYLYQSQKRVFSTQLKVN